MSCPACDERYYYDSCDEFDCDCECHECSWCGEIGCPGYQCNVDDYNIRGPICRQCGCTDVFGCDGGCYWVEPDLCSQCQLDGATIAIARAGGDRLDVVDVDGDHAFTLIKGSGGVS